MLHKETVKGSTFSLLKDLISDPVLKDFNLAGGTALALYIGHRKSIDLDLFTTRPFSASEITEHLVRSYNFKSSYSKGNTIKGYINDVKIDCIAHQYPHLKTPLHSEGIRLYSMEDIVAMKLAAIADNGSRLKDFVDIACLSTKFTLNEMVEHFQTKYPNSNPIFALKGIQYHNDIQFNEDVQIINGYMEWDSFKSRINEMIDDPDKIFENLPYR